MKNLILSLLLLIVVQKASAQTTYLDGVVHTIKSYLMDTTSTKYHDGWASKELWDQIPLHDTTQLLQSLEKYGITCKTEQEWSKSVEDIHVPIYWARDLWIQEKYYGLILVVIDPRQAAWMQKGNVYTMAHRP